MTQPDVAPTAGDTPEELIAQEEVAIAAETQPLTQAPVAVVTAPSSPVEPVVAQDVDTSDSHVHLRVVGPIWASAYVTSDKVTIDREGALVAADQVNEIVNAADVAGIQLEVG